MKRSEFIKYLTSYIIFWAAGGGALFRANPAIASSISAAGSLDTSSEGNSFAGGLRGRGVLRFGVVTDTHYAERDRNGTRYYRDSLKKMQEAIDTFNRADLDFIIELGDMKDMPSDGDPARTLTFLDTIESIFQQFKGRTYHALGNHDMDCISKEEFLSHTLNSGRAKGKNYYSFVARGRRCIVLDANFNDDGGDYCRGNFNWTSAQIPAEQLEWLEGELAANPSQPTLIFLHQLLDFFSGVPRQVCVKNAEQVVGIVERHPQVLAVFQGHHHSGNYSHRNGIHYLTLNGMIERPASENNSYAIVEVYENGDIWVEGFSSCESRKMIKA